MTIKPLNEQDQGAEGNRLRRLTPSSSCPRNVRSVRQMLAHPAARRHRIVHRPRGGWYHRVLYECPEPAIRDAAPRSRLFIYRATRDLMGVTGDTGAWLRNTMGALVLCGAPPERHWPYTDSVPDFDAEPPSFVYAIADNFEATQYFCHDAFSSDQRTSASSADKCQGLPRCRYTVDIWILRLCVCR